MLPAPFAGGAPCRIILRARWIILRAGEGHCHQNPDITPHREFHPYQTV
jgi:hypothetical protein